MLGSIRDRDTCPETEFDAPDIPDAILDAIAADNILDLSGKYGDSKMGRPIQYERLIVDSDVGSTTIEIFNRAITLFMSDSETIRRIHRVLCVVETILRVE